MFEQTATGARQLGAVLTGVGSHIVAWGRGQGPAALRCGRYNHRNRACWDLTSLLADPSAVSRVQSEWAAWRQRLHDARQAALIVPASLVGLAHGLALPDADISLIGIGGHRFFLFHSGLMVWGLEQLYLRYHRQMELHDSRTASNRVRRALTKVTGGLLGAAAVGVGVHLVLDVFQPKSVVFPFIGSLVDGTLVDDNIWLLGNALWCFRIAHDVFALVLAADFARACAWTRRVLAEPLFSSAARR